MCCGCLNVQEQCPFKLCLSVGADRFACVGQVSACKITETYRMYGGKETSLGPVGGWGGGWSMCKCAGSGFRNLCARFISCGLGFVNRAVGSMRSNDLVCQ